MPEARAYAVRRSDASRRTSERVSISAKRLGEVALPDFCPRCFWIKLHVQYRPPFQVFPGIFSSIDSYTRKVVHQWFESHGEAPPWLSHIGRITGYRPPPHYSSFGIIDETAETHAPARNGPRLRNGKAFSTSEMVGSAARNG